MERRRAIALVDRCFRRRAAISRTLSDGLIHVEPFETIDELLHSWPQADTVLIEDHGTAVAELIDSMSERGQWLPLIAFAESPTTTGIVRAVLSGAVNYLQWPFVADQVIAALTGAEDWAEALGSVKLREARARSRVQCLTKREREVLAGVARGLSNRRIGEQLEISPRTVEIHRANMLTKMGARHTSEAIRIAIEASLVN